MKKRMNPALETARARIKGYNMGLKDSLEASVQLGSVMTLAGLYSANAQLDILSDEDFARLCRLAETEAQKELESQVAYRAGHEYDGASDEWQRLGGYVNDVRKKCGMDPLPDGTWGLA